MGDTTTQLILVPQETGEDVRQEEATGKQGMGGAACDGIEGSAAQCRKTKGKGRTRKLWSG